MTLSKVETDYKTLVDASGYTMACRSAELLCNTEHDRELLFATLTNAYWRGRADGVELARQAVKEACLGQKSN